MYRFLIVERRGPVCIVYLNRSESRNALSAALRAELVECLNRLKEDDDVKAVVLTGKGPAFCAGFDLKEMAALKPEEVQSYFRESASYHEEVLSFPKPLIAAVNGPAVAGGFDLALMCDIRIACGEAYFSHPEVKLGVAPLYSLLRMVAGDSVARELCLTGKRISAEEAAKLRMVSKVVPREKLLEEAVKLAEQICEAPIQSIMAAKKVIIEATIEELKKSMHSAPE